MSAGVAIRLCLKLGEYPSTMFVKFGVKPVAVVRVSRVVTQGLEGHSVFTERFDDFVTDPEVGRIPMVGATPRPKISSYALTP